MNVKHLQYIKKASYLCGAIFACSIPFSLIGIQFAVLLGFVLSCLLFVYSKSRPSINLIDMSVFIYLVAVVVSWAGIAGLQVDWLRMSGIWPVVGYFAARGYFKHAVMSEKIQSIWLTIAFFVSCYAIGQYFLGYDLVRGLGAGSVYRAQADPDYYAVIGLFNRHHTYAISFIMSLSFLLSSMLLKIDTKFSSLKTISTLFIIFSILLTQSRIGWLLLFTILTMFLFMHRKKKIVWAIFGICFIFFITYLVLDKNVVDRFYNMMSFSGFNSRKDIYHISFLLFSERIFSGWGFGRFFLETDFLFSQLHPYIAIRSGTHNEFLAHLNAGSLLLIFSYVNMVVIIVFRVTCLYYKENNYQALSLGVPLICLFIAGMGHNVLVDGELSLVFWCFFGMLSSLDIVNPIKKNKNIAFIHQKNLDK